MFITIRDFSLHAGIRIILEWLTARPPWATWCFCGSHAYGRRPCFSWNNLVTSTNAALGICADGQPTEVAGRDFYKPGNKIAARLDASIDGCDLFCGRKWR